MPSELTYYYLNQMGIIPWVVKATPINPSPRHQADKHVIVLMSADDNLKVLSLVKRIVACIPLTSVFLDVDDKNGIHCWHQELNQTAPVALWSLSSNAEDFIREFKMTCPILSSLDPLYVLNNPSSKRQVFADITALKVTLGL